MKFEEFLTKYEIKLKPNIKKVCEDGINEMKKSKDPAHDDVHVFDVLGILDLFLQNSQEIDTEDIDFRILLPSIFWHDVWKSRRCQTKNLLKFQFEQIWDGIGSAKIFKAYSKNIELSKHNIEEILFAIRYHGGFYRKLLKSDHSLESKILCDMDRLGFWSMERLEYIQRKYLDFNGKFCNPKYLPLAIWVLKKLAKRRESYFFKWSEDEFNRRKEAMFEKGYEIMRKNMK